jgi:hypothetical protein
MIHYSLSEAHDDILIYDIHDNTWMFEQAEYLHVVLRE